MSRWFNFILALGVLTALGCGSKEHTEQQSEQQTATVSQDQERSDYEGSAERRLSALGARIDSLKAEMEGASAETKAAIQTEIDELEIKRQEASRKLDELRAAGAERWQDVRREMATMLDDLDQRFDRMRARLRQG